MTTKKLLAGFTFITSLALSVIFFSLQSQLKDMQALGLFGIFMINFVSSASFFISAPAFLSVFAGGTVYPPLFVGLVSSFGSAMGDMIAYLFGLSGRHLAHKKLHKKFWFRVFEDYFKIHGKWVLFSLALIPNPIFDSFGILAGIFAYPLWKFLLWTFLGRFVRFYILAKFGEMF